MDASTPAAWPGDLGPVFLSEDEIQERVAELGAQISSDYAGKDLAVIGVLKGVLFFMADLLRAITIPLAVDFLAISRYGPSQQTHGIVRLTKDLNETVADRHVLFVEDIIDTGHTLDYLTRILREREPASLRICTLLNKQERREVEIPIDYVGFNIPNKFVYGYGLDLDQLYRNLPYVAVFKPGQDQE